MSPQNNSFLGNERNIPGVLQIAAYGRVMRDRPILPPSDPLLSESQWRIVQFRHYRGFYSRKEAGLGLDGLDLWAEGVKGQ
jgi:hypothetical protein